MPTLGDILIKNAQKINGLKQFEQSEAKKQKALTIGLDEKQKKSLRVLLRHQKNICRMKEDRRREKYQR